MKGLGGAWISGKDEEEEDLDVGNDEVKKERDDENEEDVSSFKKIVIKSDLNRNTVVQDSDKEWFTSCDGKTHWATAPKIKPLNEIAFFLLLCYCSI